MDNIKSYLSFKIGSEYYAANVSYVQNIIEYSEITKVPEMPEYMLGITNLRGKVLPVVDARIKFGIENTEITTNTCILVMEVQVDDEDIFVGTLVDGVSEVLEIEQEEIKETPSIGTTVKNEFIHGIYHDDEKFIMILNMNKIFSSDAVLNMNELSKGIEV